MLPKTKQPVIKWTDNEKYTELIARLLTFNNITENVRMMVVYIELNNRICLPRNQAMQTRERNHMLQLIEVNV